MKYLAVLFMHILITFCGLQPGPVVLVVLDEVYLWSIANHGETNGIWQYK